MWCTDCGARFTEEEIKGWGCPKCGCQGIPCGVDKDTTVEINWHELHILCVWAENWAQQCKDKGGDDSSEGLPRTVHAIARRLQAQRPTFGHLTLSGEIAALPSDLAKTGIEIGNVETNIPKPGLLPVNGPGAVGPSHFPPDKAQTDEIAAAIHEGRFSEGKEQINYCSFDDECSSGRQYCRRLAREILKRFDVFKRPAAPDTEGR
jgi:hypothetical protein